MSGKKKLLENLQLELNALKKTDQILWLKLLV